LKVLVIDDEPAVCWALATLLRGHGFDVVTAGSGAEALRWLGDTAAAGCRLILVDAKLGDCEGFDLARRIRSETDCTAPMIMVSGYFYKDDSAVQETLRAGLVAAFVTKPFRHAQMLGTIHAVLAAAASSPR
jgi:DNA-binding response OmpR family regulator